MACSRGLSGITGCIRSAFTLVADKVLWVGQFLGSLSLGKITAVPGLGLCLLGPALGWAEARCHKATFIPAVLLKLGPRVRKSTVSRPNPGSPIQFKHPLQPFGVCPNKSHKAQIISFGRETFGLRFLWLLRAPGLHPIEWGAVTPNPTITLTSGADSPAHPGHSLFPPVTSLFLVPTLHLQPKQAQALHGWHMLTQAAGGLLTRDTNHLVLVSENGWSVLLQTTTQGTERSCLAWAEDF